LAIGAVSQDCLPCQKSCGSSPSFLLPTRAGKRRIKFAASTSLSAQRHSPLEPGAPPRRRVPEFSFGLRQGSGSLLPFLEPLRPDPGLSQPFRQSVSAPNLGRGRLAERKQRCLPTPGELRSEMPWWTSDFIHLGRKNKSCNCPGNGQWGKTLKSPPPNPGL